VGLLLGSLGPVFFVSFGLMEFAGWLAILGFLAALFAEMYTATTKPDRAWYEGRAAAESVKTLAWRYAVRGESFEGDSEAAKLDALFVARVREVLDDLGEIELSHSSGATTQITEPMRQLRASPFQERLVAYRDGRIEDQRSWYESKAEWNRIRRLRWTVVVIGAEVTGVLGGVALVTGLLQLDLISVLGAFATAAIAWTQAKQYSTLATAYGITAQELASVAAEVSGATEATWASFVGQAEEAISREHTLWRATRGVRIRNS